MKSILVFLFFCSFTRGINNNLIDIYDLKIEEVFEVDSIIINVRSAFEGSKVNWEFEKYLFKLGNSIHHNTRIRVIESLLLFSKNDKVNREILIESEINLRSKTFLADARIKIKEELDGKNYIHVTVFDQWSTVPATGLKRIGDQWTYWAGLSEKNLFGTGLKISFSVHKKLRARGYTLAYKNHNLLNKKTIYSTDYTKNNNGYYFESSINKPVISNSQKFSFLINYIESKGPVWYYFNGNNFNTTSKEEYSIGQTNLLIKFENVFRKSATIGFTKSYGDKIRFHLSTFSQLFQQTHLGRTIVYHDNDVNDNLVIQYRRDALLGISFKLNKNRYSRIKNLTNLKWHEDFNKNTGLTIFMGKNSKFLGADNEDYLLGCNLEYSNSHNSKHFFITKSSYKYFLSDYSKKRNGDLDLKFNYISKLTKDINAYISSQWKSNIGKLKTDQVTLGESSGLLGYPNFYFTGDRLCLINTELVLIPDLEVFTIIPAIAIFSSSGNTFQSTEKIKLNNLNSSIGIGLRLGLSRSSDKIISHINLSWPLNSLLKGGPILSIKSKKEI
tara:strand:- start:395 stop:2065 length:1671 start_codon:yes stop_codon:yes gene_type:complete